MRGNCILRLSTHIARRPGRSRALQITRHRAYTSAMLPDRHRPIHLQPSSIISRPVIVFVTVCTAKRKPILARDNIASLLLDAWRKADHWLVGRYVVMPDHLHLFAIPAREDSLPLCNWVRYWKSIVSRAWPDPQEQPVWQKDFWDRQLRSDENYAEKWDYVRCNPVRHKLVRRAEDWAYQGEIHELRW